MPLSYTAEDKLTFANHDCDKVDLKFEPTRFPESRWLWDPGVVDVCRRVSHMGSSKIPFGSLSSLSRG